MSAPRRVLAVVVDDEGRVERFLTRQELEALLDRQRAARWHIALIVLTLAGIGWALIATGVS